MAFQRGMRRRGAGDIDYWRLRLRHSLLAQKGAHWRLCAQVVCKGEVRYCSCHQEHRFPRRTDGIIVLVTVFRANELDFIVLKEKWRFLEDFLVVVSNVDFGCTRYRSSSSIWFQFNETLLQIPFR